MSSQEWPTVAVLIPTFNRGELLNQNLRYLGANLKYEGSVKILVGDDSNDDSLVFLPEQSTVESTFPIQYWRNTERLGLGGNLNKLIEMAGSETLLAIAMDDDHRLVKPLDITPFVKKLLEDPAAGWIRLMGTDSHKLSANLEGAFWRVSWWSSELYITSFRAHIFKLQDWSSMYGPYPVTEKIGQCEEKFAHICIDIARERINRGLPTLDVLVPLRAPEEHWSESGHSFQLQGY
jgi:GT2 family glycosyltransferase